MRVLQGIALLLVAGLLSLGCGSETDDSLTTTEQKRLTIDPRAGQFLAYAASIGGFTTLVGTPPNAIFSGKAQSWAKMPRSRRENRRPSAETEGASAAGENPRRKGKKAPPEGQGFLPGGRALGGPLSQRRRPAGGCRAAWGASG